MCSSESVRVLTSCWKAVHRRCHSILSPASTDSGNCCGGWVGSCLTAASCGRCSAFTDCIEPLDEAISQLRFRGLSFGRSRPLLATKARVTASRRDTSDGTCRHRSAPRIGRAPCVQRHPSTAAGVAPRLFRSSTWHVHQAARMLSPATWDGPGRAARGVGRHTGCPAQRIVRRVPNGLMRLSLNPRPTAGVGPLRRSAAKRPPVLGRSPLALRPTSWPSGTEPRIQHPVAHARLGKDVGGLPRHRPACQLSPLTGGEHQPAGRPGMVDQPPGERGTLSPVREWSPTVHAGLLVREWVVCADPFP